MLNQKNSVADSDAEAFNRSSDPDQLKHEQPLLNPLLVGGVADSQLANARRQAPVSKPFSLYAHRDFYPTSTRQAPSAKHLFPNLFHFTNTKSFTPPHSIAILFHILFIFIFIFKSFRTFYRRVGLATMLINCESSEKGLETGAWRLALGGLSWELYN